MLYNSIMDIKKIICFLILLFIAAIFTPVQAVEDEDELFFKTVSITDGSELSVFDCVAAAFKNSPKIKKQKYNLDIAKSNVGIARSQYFPVISAGVGFYNENNSDNIYYNSHYRDLPSVGVTINQLVWNFGKTTAYIKMEEFYKLGAEYEFMDSLCSTLFDVKAKYYNLLKSIALKNLAENYLLINEDFIKLSKKEPDLTTAKINYDEAEIRLIDAENQYENAKVDLSNSMYIDDNPNYMIKNTKSFPFVGAEFNSSNFEPVVFNFPLDKAVDIAYENSPDLNVLVATKNAMEQSLIFIKRNYLPDLNLNAGYTYDKSNITSNNHLHVGLNLSSSVNLMELKHSIKGASAQLNLADNEINLFKKNLYFEVKRAFNNVEKAQNRIPVANEEVLISIENLEIAKKKYQSGEIDYVALQNAGKDYYMAVSEYIQSLYDYNISLIQTEMAMHYHIIDIHHKSEHAVHYHFEELINHLNKVLDCDEKEEHKPLSKNRK